DGIASAVLAIDFLRNVEGWSGIDAEHVNYDVRASWLTTRFHEPTAIVDFLYHPDAVFWADHHRTTFLNSSVERHFRERESDSIIYDAKAGSCAGLLWRRLSYRDPRRAELVEWAEKIDAARYESVEEALSFAHPALRISVSLARATDGYSERLVALLSEHSVSEVAGEPEVRQRFLEVEHSMREGLDRVRAAARLRDDIIVFDVDAGEVIVPRYSPWLMFPDARYSVGLVRRDDGAKITAMRNPWLEFESVPLGDIFTRYGGGGHQRVASANITDAASARTTLEQITTDITNAERERAALPRR
ncbi:MAG TPA: hypothetical protein VMU84_17690, partial [Thermoanaerobaculia bacterium]|nr:hypothetical protein [Thermoanaerobaculia bacterium]